MDRLLTVIVFLALQGAGLLTAMRWQEAVTDWMAGGYWVAPAVRVPLVAFAIVVAEIALLAAVYPCNRLTHRVLGRRPC
jgi:mannose/fructose/N-acetylgalactosamine-specific phosphotransferase system component IIC